MDLVFGGGKYGTESVEYLIEKKRNFIVLDVDSECHVSKKYALPKLSLREIEQMDKPFQQSYFVEGGVYEALKIIEQLDPEYIFPTAPLHVVAAILQEKYRLSPWYEGIDTIFSGIPSKIILSSGKGSVVVSYNRDRECLPMCNAPERCPVTDIVKPAPMYRMLRFACIDGYILESHQLKPGIGALKGEEVKMLIKWAKNKDRMIVGTACRCHGVVTALKTNPQ